MRKKAKKNRSVILGYILVIVGIIFPLTGFLSISYRNLTQNIRYRKFIEESKNFTKEELDSIKKYNKSVEGNYYIDPFINEEYKVNYDFISNDPDAIFAYLIIDKINLKKPIYIGASDKHLEMGLAQVDGTALPIGGINKRPLIAGHRGWYGDLMFYNLDKLSKGDIIRIERNDKKLFYQVIGTSLIKNTDVDAVKPIKDKDMLTLMTCDPIIPPYPTRLIVDCERIEISDSHDSNKSSDEIVKGKVKKENTEITKDTGVKKIENIIYVITAVLILFLIIAVRKFIKFLRG